MPGLGIRRQHMRLQLVIHLYAVLQAPQKGIPLDQVTDLTLLQDAHAPHLAQYLDRTPALQTGVLTGL